jgi:uncharacterized heparinase superfamily protein
MPATGRENWRQVARATAAHSTVTFNDTSSARFLESAAFKRVLGGSPMLGGPEHVSVTREDRPDAIVLRASHDGYADRYGVLHERTLLLANDGSRLDGEDLFLAADGSPQLRTSYDQYAVRFHLHPTIKANRLTDGHGVMLMTANREVWTFSAHEDRVELEESVYLAGAEGPRRTVQMVIYGHARKVPRVLWTIQLSNQMAAATASPARRARGEEPELPL